MTVKRLIAAAVVAIMLPLAAQPQAHPAAEARAAHKRERQAIAELEVAFKRRGSDSTACALEVARRFAALGNRKQAARWLEIANGRPRSERREVRYGDGELVVRRVGEVVDEH